MSESIGVQAPLNPFEAAGGFLDGVLGPDVPDDDFERACDLAEEDNVIDLALWAAEREWGVPAKWDPVRNVVTEAINDAHVLGVETDAFNEMLQKPATLMVGAMWGARDRRNTQDNQWVSTTLPWAAWIAGGAGDKNTPAWGFSRHPVNKTKEGPCIVLGSSVGKARQARAMSEMAAMGVDIDAGAKLDDVLNRLEELGLFCLVYTSHSHGKVGLQLKRDDVLRKLKIDAADLTLEYVHQFLRDHDKNRYDVSFIDQISVKDWKKQVKQGVVIELDTPPLDKFRLIFPLAEALNIVDLADTHADALELWESKITGLATELLGVHFDTSCTDPSRLFFTARHPKGADDWYCAVVHGDPLKFEDVPTVKKSTYTSHRKPLNAFEMAGGADDDRPPQCSTPSGASLNEWHSKAKGRFQLADLLEDYCGDRIRRSGGEAAGHVHTECPFEAEHSDEGGTATMAVNAIDSQSEYWSWFCHHDSCQGRHKLQFLEEALRQDWFPEEQIFGDSVYLLEGDDEDDPLATVEQKAERASAARDKWVAAAQAFTAETTEAEIRDLLTQARDELDETGRAAIGEIIVNATLLKKSALNRIWKEVEREASKRRKAGKSAGGIVNEDDFSALCEYGQAQIDAANKDDPAVFHNAHDLCAIRAGSDRRFAIRPLDRYGFAHYLNSVATFSRTYGDDGKAKRGVSAPTDVVSHLFAADYAQYPPLDGIVTTPIFTPTGTLLTQPGYDPDSRLYYQPDPNLAVPPVSPAPTDDEVKEAKRLLIQEVLADFPLGGIERAEIVRRALGCREEDSELLTMAGEMPQSVPDVAHAIALALQPFVRDMVGGNAPGFAFNKRKAGTGATKLVGVLSMIYGGRAAPAMALPQNNEEMTKVLLPVLRGGDPLVFFDNINHAVDSGELASAMTAQTYQARVLGTSSTVEVDVRCAWCVSGNNLRLSSELTRRFVLSFLDAGVAEPEKRTGWRHDDLEGWVLENRGRLVWACLTLVQNWIARGSVAGDYDKSSYSEWARTLGGILDAAGIHGFLGNEGGMAELSTAGDDPVRILLEHIAEMEDGTRIVTGSTARVPDAVSVKEVLEAFYDGHGLKIPGWGCDAAGDYTNLVKLGLEWKAVASVPHRVGDWEIRFDSATDSGSKSAVWTLRKTPMCGG